MKIFIDPRVLPFIDKLTVALKVDVREHIKLMEDNGFALFPPVLKKLSGYNLWELRPRNIRLLLGKNDAGAVIVVGFHKTTNKTPPKIYQVSIRKD